MKAIQLLLISIITFTFTLSAQASPLDFDQPIIRDGKILMEANDAGEEVWLTEQEYTELTGQKFVEHLVSFFNFKKSWEEVASYITPTLEDEFDVFIVVNVDFESRFNGAHDIPAQHMKVLQRTRAGQSVFKRRNGRVVGIQSNVAGNNGVPAFKDKIKGIKGNTVSGVGILDDLMPISSGASQKGGTYVDTPTGIYRINHRKSDLGRYGKGMYHSMYFDLIYPSGRSSGLAVHGTDKNKYSKLGTQQSHGCIRTTQAQANVMYENLINDDFWWTSDLPDLNNRKRLKAENGGIKAGTRALIIVFYGYENSQWDI